MYRNNDYFKIIIAFAKEHVDIKGKIIKCLFALFSIILLMWSLYAQPDIYGDGWEYLAMTISFANHATPDLQKEDIAERHKVAAENNLKLSQSIEYGGYFKSLSGKFYSYHFWFYSLLCVIPYLFLDFIGFNALKVFQLTNSLLMISALWWLIYKSKLEEKGKIWLSVALLFGPVWLYMPWSHTEVYSFVFLFIGLLELVDNKRLSACIFISIASLQNPAIALIAIGIVVCNLIKTKKILKENILLGASLSIIFIPYLFYFLNYHKFSLITGISATTKAISLGKIISLFIDPNFGLIFYIPVLFIVFFILVLKGNKKAIIYVISLFLMATICSTQFNWNCGMMYIHRYSYWMIPVIMIGSIDYFLNLKWKKIVVLSSIYIITTGVVIMYSIKEYDQSNYVDFSPLAKVILSQAPLLYNPHPEVFAERALRGEYPYGERLPIMLVNSDGIRKMLIIDEFTGKMSYINGPTKLFSSNKLLTLQNMPGNKDIFARDTTAGFISGWCNLENQPKLNISH